MREESRQKEDPFLHELNYWPQRYKALFRDLLIHAKHQTVIRDSDILSRDAQWMAVQRRKVSVPVQDALEHLSSTINVVRELPPEFKEINHTMATIKNLLVQRTFSTPADLSAFYQILREKQNMLFGDIVAHTVGSVYRTQDPSTHSLLSQIIYTQALAQKLFSELPLRDDAKKETQSIKVLRKLKNDFNTLAIIQLTDDYQRAGRSQVRFREKNENEFWPMPHGPIQRFFLEKASVPPRSTMSLHLAFLWTSFFSWRRTK